MNYKKLRVLRYVPRWVIVPHIHKQNVAEHSYYVALHTISICDALECNTLFKSVCIQYALTHDEEEAETGDIPSTADIDKPTSYADPAIKSVVKIADLMESLDFVADEKSIGNNISEVDVYLKAKLISAIDGLAGRFNEERVKKVEMYVDNHFA